MFRAQQYFCWMCLGIVISLLNVVRGEEITQERILKLPADQMQKWNEYIERSRKHEEADRTFIEAEVLKAGLKSAIKAPDGGDFKLSHKPGDVWYKSDEAQQLAEIILSYQAPCGGWSKHTGYSKGKRVPGMLFSSQYEPGKSPHYLCTFDNRSTTEQIQYLGSMWQATPKEEYKQAILRGLGFIFNAQFPHGGWPQVYPLEGGYHDNITLNDNAIVHILELLYQIKSGDPRFAFLSAEMLQKADAAFNQGINCVIKMQYRQGSALTAWCAQHDPLTLLPAPARAMEPASLSGLESAGMVKFLMTIKNPSPELKLCIESCLLWLDQVKITDIKETTLNGKKTYIADTNSKELHWARFYDLVTNKPVFPGRNGKIYDTFEAMAAENKLGYDYLSTGPQSIITNGQKKWRSMLEKK